MDYKRIEELLEKYWACETTIIEEKELKSFCSSDHVPEHLKDVAKLFEYFENEGLQKKLGTDFDEKVLSQLDTRTAPKGKEVKMVKWWNNYSKVAAVVLMVVALSVFITNSLQYEQEHVEVADTFENPDDAFEETKKALLLISNKIGKGKSQMGKLSTFSKAEEKIKNNEVEL